MLESLIGKLGLTENQAKIYMALIEDGPTLVSEIAQKSDINRTTCYDVLEKLVGYGLVSYASGEGSKKRYVAESPACLVGYLDRKKRIYQNRLDDLKEKLPELLALYKRTERPVVKFLEGDEAVETFLNNSADETVFIPEKDRPEVLTITDLDAWDTPDLSRIVKRYFKRIAKYKYPERMLIMPTKKSLNWVNDYPALIKEKMQIRLLPENRFNFFFTEVNIIDNQVWFMTLEKSDRVVVEITSRHLANTLRILFEMAWETAERYNLSGKIDKRKNNCLKNLAV